MTKKDSKAGTPGLAGSQSNSGKLGPRQIIPVVTFFIGVMFLWMGLAEYGFWEERQGPLPGFFPAIMAVIMMLSSVLAFIFSFREKQAQWPVTNWNAILGGISIFISTFIIGLLPSVVIYLLVWLRKYEQVSWRTTLLTTAITMAIVYGAFVMWLGVPFPLGFIGEAIWG